MEEIQRAHDQLGRDQRDAGGRVAVLGEHDREGAVGLDPVAAAREEAADPSEGLAEGHGGHSQVKVGERILLFPLQIEDAADEAYDQASVDHKAVRGVFQIIERPRDEIRQDRQEEEQLRADHSGDQADERESDREIGIFPVALREFREQDAARDEADGDHHSVAVDMNVSDTE